MRERLFTGQINLIGWQRPFRWRHGWPAAGLLARGLLLGLALPKLGLVLSLLPFEALRRAGFDLGAGLGRRASSSGSERSAWSAASALAMSSATPAFNCASMSFKKRRRNAAMVS